MNDPALIATLVGAIVTMAGLVTYLAKAKAARKDRTTDRIIIAPASSGDLSKLSTDVRHLAAKLDAMHGETMLRLEVLGGEITALRDWRNDMSQEVARLGARLDERDRRR